MKFNARQYSLASFSVLIALSGTAHSATTYMEARNDAMGGTGVASSHYGTAALANPALLTHFGASDDFSLILPSVGAQVPIPCLSTWASPVMTPKAFLSELAEPAPDLNAPTPETPIPLIPVGLPVHVDFLSQWHSFQAAPHSVVSFFPSESLRRQSVRPLYSVHRLPD